MFAEQKGHLDYFFDEVRARFPFDPLDVLIDHPVPSDVAPPRSIQLSFDEVAALCQKIIDCKGTTLFTGVGKTSFVAKKVCQTLASTGTRSIFLNAVDALHGDIGVVRSGDVLVMLSGSGETHELVTLLPYAKAKGAFVVACTNAPNSALAKRADAHVRVPGDGDVARVSPPSATRVPGESATRLEAPRSRTPRPP